MVTLLYGGIFVHVLTYYQLRSTFWSFKYISLFPTNQIRPFRPQFSLIFEWFLWSVEYIYIERERFRGGGVVVSVLKHKGSDLLLFLLAFSIIRNA